MAKLHKTDRGSLGKSNRRGKPVVGVQGSLFVVAWEELGRTREPSLSNLGRSTFDTRDIIKVDECSQPISQEKATDSRC